MHLSGHRVHCCAEELHTAVTADELTADERVTADLELPLLLCTAEQQCALGVKHCCRHSGHSSFVCIYGCIILRS